MKYDKLNITAHKSPKRVGRGIAAGRGKTAGRGTKGQNSRPGSNKNPGFEGGQNPLMRRLPKLHGFRSYKPVVEQVYTGQLDQLAGKTIDSYRLAEQGLISNAFVLVKLLSKGEVTKKVTGKLPAASAGAIAQVEKAGGSFELTPRAARPVSSKKIKAAE